MSTRSLFIAAGAVAAITNVASAEEPSRELGAHEHGHGTFNIAVEGHHVFIELEAPGADIVGFEHPAETDEDRALIEDAIAVLARPLDLFVLPEAAGCQVVDARATLVGEDDHDDDHHEDHADEHDDDHADEHAEDHDDDYHDEHADEHHDDHGDDHADEHAEHEESHTEFRAAYELACAEVEVITSIDFAYFDAFPNAVELDVQMLSAAGSFGYEVERDNPVLDLTGSI